MITWAVSQSLMRLCYRQNLRFFQSSMIPVSLMKIICRQQRFGMSSRWETWKIDYHDHYLKSQVLLLTDVFEEFRNESLKNYKIDPTGFSPRRVWPGMRLSKPQVLSLNCWLTLTCCWWLKKDYVEEFQWSQIVMEKTTILTWAPTTMKRSQQNTTLISTRIIFMVAQWSNLFLSVNLSGWKTFFFLVDGKLWKLAW